MELPLILLLCGLIRSDFSKRCVRADMLLLFGLAQLCYACRHVAYQAVLAGILQNVLVLAVWAGGVLVFYSVRRRQLVVTLKEKIGRGDICFLFCLTPVFGMRGFVWFLLAGFSVSLAYWRFAGGIRTVPLVGTLGGCYIILLLCNACFMFLPGY